MGPVAGVVWCGRGNGFRQSAVFAPLTYVRHSGLAFEIEPLAGIGSGSDAQGDRGAAARSRLARSTVIEDYTSSLATDAIVRLRAVGLCPAVQPTRCLREAEHGRVVGQDPPAGERLLRGQIVQLVIAERVESAHLDDVSGDARRQPQQSSRDVQQKGSLGAGEVARSDPSAPQPLRRPDLGSGAGQLRGLLDDPGLSDSEPGLAVEGEADVAGVRLGLHCASVGALGGGEGLAWGGAPPQPEADAELREDSARERAPRTQRAWCRRSVMAMVAVAMAAPVAVTMGGGHPSSPRSRAALLTPPVIGASAHSARPAAGRRDRPRVVLRPRPARKRRQAATAGPSPVVIRQPSDAGPQAGGSPPAASVPSMVSEASSTPSAAPQPAPAALRQAQQPVPSDGSSPAQFFRP
jgi:hypothetical protein